MKKNLIFKVLVGCIFFTTLFFVNSCKKDKEEEQPTIPVPEVRTAGVSSVLMVDALCGGEVINDGGSVVTARGVCWSKSPNPTTSDSKTVDGDGAGIFTSKITGLIPQTKYYIRAYATNAGGTSYGSTITMTTIDSTVTDIEGNIYRTVQIGSQIWMTENLMTTKYRNGTNIPEITDNTVWAGMNSGAYCNYNNNTSNGTVYGHLYNWYAATDSRNIAPVGWHVPSWQEWCDLYNYLGLDSAGLKLREAGTSHWVSPNAGATNETGFTALPGGYRSGSEFLNMHSMGAWCTTTANSADVYMMAILVVQFPGGCGDGGYKYFGGSIRCVRD